MNEMIEGLLINLDNNQVEEIGLDKDAMLGALYKAIDCDTIDVVRNVRIGKNRFDIIVDDNGLAKDNPKPSARCMDAEQYLFGNIVILNADDEKGEWYSLSDEDIFDIQKHIFGIQHRDTQEISPLLEYYYGDVDDENTQSEFIA